MIGGLRRDRRRQVLQLRWHVRRFHRVVREVTAEAAAELVRATAGHKVDPDAAGLLLDVLARRGDLDLLEVVEVEIGRRRTGGRHVRNDDAVERPDRVLRPRTLRDDGGCLTGFVAADIHAVEQHARDGTHQRERIARGRNLRELVARERRRGAGCRGIENRCGDGQRFDDRRHTKLHRRVNVPADGDDDVARGGSEARERHGDRVQAWLQIQEAEGTVEFGGEVIGRIRALDADISSRDDGTLFIANEPADAAALGLGNRGKGGRKHNCTRKEEAFHAS